MAKRRDVGMAGSSDYATEYYTTDAGGNPVRNERTMRLQGMDPNKRIANSRRQEERMEAMMDNGIQPSRRDRVRAHVLGAGMNEVRKTYSEGKFQDRIERDASNRQDLAIDRGERQNEIIEQQARQAYIRKQVGKNDFNPSGRTVPTLSKMIKAGNKKRK